MIFKSKPVPPDVSCISAHVTSP